MKFRLISYEELEGTGYAEFQPGGFYIGRCWSNQSVYMDWETFEVVDRLVSHFNPGGPITLSGSLLMRCIEDLSIAATRVSKAESPNQIWDCSSGNFCERLLEIRDWPRARRDISLMLRDLETWMRAVHARGEPVTCLG